MKVEDGVLIRVRDEDIIDGKFEFPEGIKEIDYDAFHRM